MNDMRDYFPFFEYNKDITYLDSANTSQILGACLSSYIKYHYYSNYNIGRASYTGARHSQQLKDWALQSAADFFGTKKDNIIFTSGATEGLNIIAKSFVSMFKKMKLKPVILTTELEHASAILPWMALFKDIDIKYIKLTEDYRLTVDNLKAAIDEYNPDILILASMTNTTGEIRPLKKIGEITKEHKITFIVDHAQGAAHVPVDVQECNIDFLTCSMHKMYGPKGVGILYARRPEFLRPIKFGGGMNKWFNKNNEFELLDNNDRFYAGTENVPSEFCAMEAIAFVKNNWEQIRVHDIYLGTYLYKLLSRIPQIKIYSVPNSSIILFNIDGFEPLDVMNYLDKKNIYIRAGNHCSKLTGDLFGLATCRVSLGIYNTEEDLIKLYKALREMMGDELCLNNVQDQNLAKLENVEQTSVR